MTGARRRWRRLLPLTKDAWAYYVDRTGIDYWHANNQMYMDLDSNTALDHRAVHVIAEDGNGALHPLVFDDAGYLVPAREIPDFVTVGMASEEVFAKNRELILSIYATPRNLADMASALAEADKETEEDE